MKKNIFISLVLVVCLMFLSACVKTDDSDTAADINENQEKTAVNEQQTDVTETNVTETDVTDDIMKEDGMTGDDQSGPEIIAESSNTVSDKEKQEILDGISEDLEDVLDSLDDLDDLDDSDLDIEDF